MDIYSGMPATDLPPLTWRKSRRSNANGNCVEMAMLAGNAGIAVRNSRDPNGPVLVYTHDEIVAFVLARSSRGLLLGEAAIPKVLAAIKQAIESHPNVEKVVELLTMHLAPKQILINAHLKMRPDLLTTDVVKTIEEIE